MPQYRFQLRGKLGHIPGRGAHFENDAAARLHAEYMAAHLGDIDPAGHIDVTNEAGVTIARCPAILTARAA